MERETIKELDNLEPFRWWTPEERQKAQDGLIISEPRKNWRGRTYRLYTSLPWHNIYNEVISWKEYEINNRK